MAKHGRKKMTTSKYVRAGMCAHCQLIMSGEVHAGRHCKGTAYDCKCKCSDYPFSCWVRGCLKQNHLSTTPYGNVCNEHLAELLAMTEMENLGFYEWYRYHYGLVVAGDAPDPAKLRTQLELEREQKEKEAQAERDRAIQGLKHILETI